MEGGLNLRKWTMEGGLNLQKYVYIGGRLKPPEVEVPPGPYLPPGGGGVAILFIIAERASSTIRLSSPPLLEALLHLARVAKVWANAPSPHGARMIFHACASRAHAHALPTPSPGPDRRYREHTPREMPIPAPPAIRTSHATNSRMGPSSPVRAPFAQVFWRRSRPTTSAGRTRRHKAHLKLFLTFGCAYPPPHPGLAHALRGQRNIHPPFFARAGGQSGAGPPGHLLGQVLRRVCRGWGEQGEVQGLGDVPTRHRAEERR